MFLWWLQFRTIKQTNKPENILLPNRYFSICFFLSSFLVGHPQTFPIGVTSFVVVKLVVCLIFQDLSHSLRSSVVSVIMSQDCGINANKFLEMLRKEWGHS